MIIIPLQNNLRIRRGIHGIWVLEKYIGTTNTENEIWKFVRNCEKIENLFIRMMDHNVILSEEIKSNLLDIQEAYNNSANMIIESISKIDLSSQYDYQIEQMEDTIQKLTTENNNLKAKIKKQKIKD